MKIQNVSLRHPQGTIKRLLIILNMMACSSCGTLALFELITPGASVPEYVMNSSLWARVGTDHVTNPGLRYQYAAGIDLRLRFQDSIFSKELTPEQIDVVSSQSSSSIESADAHLMGILNEFDGTKLKFAFDADQLKPTALKNFSFSNPGFATALPVGFMPFFSNGTNFEHELFPPITAESCPYGHYFYRKRRNDRAVIFRSLDVGIAIEDTIKVARSQYSLPPFVPSSTQKYDLSMCSHVATFVLTDYYNNEKCPIAPKDRVFSRLANCYAANSLEKISDPILMKYRISSLFRDIRRRLNENFSSLKKYVMYAGTFDSLMFVMAAFGKTKPECVIADFVKQTDTPTCFKNFKQARSLLFELEQDDDGSSYIKTSLDREYFDVCPNNSDPSKDFRCPTSKFLKIIDPFVFDHASEWCSLKIPEEEAATASGRYYQYFVASCILLMVAIFVVGYHFLDAPSGHDYSQLYKNSMVGYSQHLTVPDRSLKPGDNENEESDSAKVIEASPAKKSSKLPPKDNKVTMDRRD